MSCATARRLERSSRLGAAAVASFYPVAVIPANGQNVRMLEDRTTKLLTRLIPIFVTGNLLVALAAYYLDWPDGPVYLLLALTVVTTIVAAILFLGSVGGVRSTEALGFERLRDGVAYEATGRGVRGAALLLMFAVVIVAVSTQLSETASGLLAFFSLPLAGIFQAVTTRYPADR